MTRQTKTATIAASALLALAASNAGAADMTEVPASSSTSDTSMSVGWEFEFTPYIWGTGLVGDVAPFRKAPTVHIDQSFSEVLEDLDIAGFLNLWASNGTYGFYTDLMYVDTTERENTGPVTLPNVGTVPGIDIRVDSKIFTGVFLGAYRVVDTQRFELDALGGIRAFRVWTEVQADVPSYSASYDAKSDFGWVDPAIGFGLKYQLTDKLRFVGQADVGGFDVGSRLTWQAIGALKYNITSRTALSVGYKYMSVDYDDDGHVFDVQLQGPMAGVSFSF